MTVSRTGGTATSGTDYAAISNFTVTIAAGERSGTATLSFDPTEDDLVEGDETVGLTGSAPSSLNLTAGTAMLTIKDNDLPTGAPENSSPSITLWTDKVSYRADERDPGRTSTSTRRGDEREYTLFCLPREASTQVSAST